LTIKKYRLMKNYLTPSLKPTLSLFLLIKKIRISALITSLYLLTSLASFAQVHYTDISPDALITDRDSLLIDINQDNIIDFTIYCGYTDILLGSTFFAIKGKEHSSVAITNDSVSAIMQTSLL